MRVILYLIIAGLLISCNKEPYSTYQELIGKPAIPIIAKPGESTIIISDYILEPTSLDSISIAGNGMEIHFSLIDNVASISLNEDASKLGAISFWKGGASNQVLVKKSNKETVTFTYRGEGDNVQLKGEMNAWNPSSSSFEKSDTGWEWSKDVNPGRYQYLYVIDGVETLDPSNDISVDNGLGGRNSLLEIPRPSIETLPIFRTSSFTNEHIIFDLANDADEVFIFCENQLTGKWDTIEAGKFQVKVPEWAKKIKRTHLRMWASNDNGVSEDVLVPLEYGVPVNDRKQITRNDWHTSIMYFMMIDRFRNGNTDNDRPTPDPDILPKANHFGGDLYGIDQTIADGYFSELGVNTLWLSPITQNPDSAFGLYPEPYTKFSAYHGYWPISSSKVDDRFGTKKELDELIDHAHETNMNIILDYVANHVHEEHPLYKAHPDWATNLYLPDGSLNTEKWDEHRLTTWFDTFLPTLDLERPEVYEPMTDSALYWVTNADFDGFRHDATKHIPEVFWRTLTRKVREETQGSNRFVFQIGETYGSRELISSYISNGQIDAQFDFNIYDDAISVFARPEISMERLVAGLKETFAYYGHHNLMGYITGNQDKPRFISLASGAVRFDEDSKYAGWNRKIENNDPGAFKKLNQLQALIMTIPGIPCFYYGDEFGSPGGNDPDNRRMMKFEEDLDDNEKATLEAAKKIVSFRNNHLALTYGDFDFIHSDDETLLFKRSYFDDIVYAAFNKNDSEEVIKFNSDLGLNTNFGNQLLGEDGNYTLTLSPHSFEIITLNN